MRRCSWGKPVFMVQLGISGNKLFLWDVFICCKSAVLAKHELRFPKEDQFAVFSDCVWSYEGASLFVVDYSGSIYTVCT
ncbi:hypothetical protein NQ314_020157 [Rhamnusium bicolor]|uniref:Uncharacterized protein n=1 Tax=Rhamnusium bicolor TaxID=1586634 RepID=A0AAV8WM91_9CUCU|nr:hypothetical protein NQ314_020157 [Rhamnusium bicolor]